MPTTITVPIAERTKSIQYGATYSSALTLNPDKALLVGCSAVLSGMTVTVNTGPVPAEATVGIGAFIQNGIIVNITSAQTVQFPAAPIPTTLYLVAENDNETYNSSVQILFTTTPAADSVIIAEWLTGIETDFGMPLGISNCALRDAIAAVQMLIIQRDRQVATAGQTVFTLAPGKSYVQGANKLWVYRNGKKLDISNDYVETSGTSVTIFMPAISGDIFEFMIFKGAPPITGMALDDLSDVSTDLANAIKDISVLRVSPATAANPLATIADTVAATGLFTTVSSVAKVDGTFSVSAQPVPPPAATLADVPAPNNSVTFTPTLSSTGLIIMSGIAEVLNGCAAGMTFSVNGVDNWQGPHYVEAWGTIVPGGLAGLYNYGAGTRGVTGVITNITPYPFVAGTPYTIKMRIGAVGLNGVIVNATTVAPLFLTVLHR